MIDRRHDESRRRRMLYFEMHKQERIFFVVLLQYVVTILDRIENSSNPLISSIAKRVHFVDHLLSNVASMDHVHSTNCERINAPVMIRHSINSSRKPKQRHVQSVKMLLIQTNLTKSSSIIKICFRITHKTIA